MRNIRLHLAYDGTDYCGWQRQTNGTSIQAAVETALAWRPDLFLTDVMMPDLDGIEAAIRIRQRYSACRILLFSGNAVVHDLLAAARKRGYDFEALLKPIHPRELIDHLRFALSQR